MNNSNNESNDSNKLIGTVRLAKSLEDINKDLTEGAPTDNQSTPDEEDDDDLVEILSATLKKKIQIETNQNKEIEDDDVSNVRETMMSFLQDSKLNFLFLTISSKKRLIE